MFAYAKGAAIAAIMLSLAAPAFAESANANSHTVKSPRDPSSGQATGKRMHKPMTIHHEIDRTTDATSTASDGAAGSASPADSSAAAHAAGAPIKGAIYK